MIITAVAVGTRGDVNPLAELGSDMVKRGHEFRILTSEAFRPLIESRGVTYLHLSTDADHVMQYLVAEYKTSLDFTKGMFRLKKENPKFWDETMAAIRGSDAVMYGTCAAFARHAADALGIPAIRYFYSPMDPTEQYSLYSTEYNSPKVLKSYSGLPQGMNLMTMLALNRFRKDAGLKPWKLSSTYTEQNGRKVLTFYPTSSVFMKPDPKWGSHIHVTGYWYHPDEEAAGYEIPSELQNFIDDGETPVFVAFGKAQSPELAELQVRTLEALKRTGIRAIFQGDLLDDTQKENTEQIYFAGNMPYSSIFPKVKAVVHHGGNTTNGLALRAGKPVLVIPLALDQYFYGRMANRLGAGPAPLYIRDKLCTVEEIAASLQELVSGQYDENARKLSAQIREEDGISEAIRAIEEYVQ